MTENRTETPWRQGFDSPAPRAAAPSRRNPTRKKCQRCYNRLPLSAFQPDKRAVSGLDWICADCRANKRMTPQ